MNRTEIKKILYAIKTQETLKKLQELKNGEPLIIYEDGDRLAKITRNENKICDFSYIYTFNFIRRYEFLNIETTNIDDIISLEAFDCAMSWLI